MRWTAMALAAALALGGCGPITGRLDTLNGQLQETNNRLGSIEQGKLASMDSQLRETNQRLASVERQLAATNDKLGTLEGAVKAIPGLDPKD